MSDAVNLLILIILAFYIPALFYIRTLYTALKRCSPKNRTMKPGSTWILLIPLINVLFHFYVVFSVAKSLDNEFKDLKIESDDLPGRNIGLAMCVCTVLSVTKTIGYYFELGMIFFWIFYWIKIADYSSILYQREKAVKKSTN